MILLRMFSEKRKLKKEDKAQIATTVGIAGSSVLGAAIAKKIEDKRAVDHYNDRKRLIDADQSKETASTLWDKNKELESLEKSDLVREKKKLESFTQNYDKEIKDRGLSGTRWAKSKDDRISRELNELTEQYKQRRQQINGSAKKELESIEEYYRGAADKLAKDKNVILKKNKKAMKNRARIGVAVAVPAGLAAREIVKKSKKKNKDIK